MSKKRETRYVQARELRVQRNDAGATTIQGYAAVFNSLSQDLGGFKEKIAPGAFTACLAEKPDVRALFNHDEDHILGRTKSGTLDLSEDKTGLFWRCTLPDTQIARDLAVSIERGDIDQCSFGFYCLEDTWDLADDDTAIRTVLKAELFDVSAVTYPAYLDTSVATRALWRDGQPESISKAIETLRTNDLGCDCSCGACEDDNCAGCTNDSCDDPNCVCSEMRHLRARMRLVQADL